jgi:hypothetical protein
MDVFAGVSINFPSKSALAKLRKNQEFLNRLGDAEQAFGPGPAGEEQLLTAVLEGHTPRRIFTE